MGRFITRCRVPKRSAGPWHSIGDVVRSEFASECRREVLPQLTHRSEVIRIRRLAVQLTYTGEFDRERIARAWAKALAAELFAAMAYPNSHNGNLVHFESRTEWLARFILDLVSGTASSHWEYEEFADVIKLGTVDGVLTVLHREPTQIVPLLQLLHHQGRLNALLTLFGDLSYEQLFAIIAKTQAKSDIELAITDLLTVGELARSELPVAGLLATRRRAMLIFLQLIKTDEASVSRWSPRRVFYALIALDTLVNLTQSMPPEMWKNYSMPQLLAHSSRSLNATIVAVLERIRRVAADSDETSRKENLPALLSLLQSLANDVVATTDIQKQSPWVCGDCIGFLLLAGLIERFRWPQHLLESELGRRWGNRAVTCFLAGLAQHLLGKNPDSRDLDPGVAIFAGWLQPASADANILRTFLSSASDEDRLDVVSRLDPTLVDDQEKLTIDWSKTCEHLGNYILHEFATRVRGFRKATPVFVVNAFLKQAGRVCIDEKRILVILEPNPFHIALHLSGADEPIDSVSWLGGRRLEFQLEGL